MILFTESLAAGNTFKVLLVLMNSFDVRVEAALLCEIFTAIWANKRYLFVNFLLVKAQYSMRFKTLSTIRTNKFSMIVSNMVIKRFSRTKFFVTLFARMRNKVFLS